MRHSPRRKATLRHWAKRSPVSVRDAVLMSLQPSVLWEAMKPKVVRKRHTDARHLVPDPKVGSTRSRIYIARVFVGEEPSGTPVKTSSRWWRPGNIMTLTPGTVTVTTADRASTVDFGGKFTGTVHAQGRQTGSEGASPLGDDHGTKQEPLIRQERDVSNPHGNIDRAAPGGKRQPGETTSEDGR